MLDLTVTSTEPADVEADLLVLALGEAELEGGGLLERTDARVGGVLRRAAGEERFRAKLGQTLVVHVRDLRAQRIALVGLGAGPDASGQALRVAAGGAARVAASVGAARTAFAWSSSIARRRARVRGRRRRRAARRLPLRQVPDRRAQPRARDDDVDPAAAGRGRRRRR